MKRFLLASAAVLLFIAGYFTSFWFAVPSGSSSVQAVFSPDETEKVLMQVITSASKSVDVMLYQFSYAPLQDSLVQAARRNVRVRVILDRKIDANLYTADVLARGGVEGRWASQDYASTHAKSIVADGENVFVGSPNWSRHAMRLNREAGVLVRDAKIAKEFTDVFETDWTKAAPWKP